MELLTVIAIIGVLMALLLPAVQASREAARRNQCQNNLKQIGLGLIHYHDQHESFPIGCLEWRSSKFPNNRQLAWSAFVLPFVEQRPLYEQLDLSKTFDDPANAYAASMMLSVFVCPSVPEEYLLLASGRGPTHYGGIFGELITTPNNPPKGVMLVDQAIRTRDVLDGTTYTLIVAEDSQFPDGEWINGRNIFDQGYAINSPEADPKKENDIRSEHPGGANGVTCGGSVHFLSENIDLKVLAALCTRAGNEPIGDWQ